MPQYNTKYLIPYNSFFIRESRSCVLKKCSKVARTSSDISGLVGTQDNREKVLWGFHSIFVQNVINNLLLFFAPTRPSRHMI